MGAFVNGKFEYGVKCFFGDWIQHYSIAQAFIGCLLYGKQDVAFL